MNEKLTKLRALFDAHEVDGYLIPRSDEYQGEFVASYAERLKYVTGFTGSAGFALVLRDDAVVMSDGRYSVQLKNEVDQDCFDLADNTKIKVKDWLAQSGQGEAVIGYDPMLYTAAQIGALEKSGVALKPVPVNLVDAIWNDQPEKPLGAVEVFLDSIAGQGAEEKIEIVAQELRKNDVQACIIAAPESICWLLNMRGNDVDYIPIILSSAILRVSEEVVSLDWFIAPEKISEELRAALPNTVSLRSPDEFESALGELSGQDIALDASLSPVAMKQALESADAIIKTVKDPCVALRAVKTEAEQNSIRKAHIKDGAALVKFLCWLDVEGQTAGLDEYEIGQKLLEFRAQNAANDFRGESFPAIIGYQDNGAIVHYRAKQGSAKRVEGSGLLLMDSGGQYRGGTTDITRTVLIGDDVSEEIKRHFTLVLKGHIALAMAKFPQGTTGAQMDVFARQALWAEGLDFAHGTGHGVGCYLSVHEWAAHISPRGKDALKPGMLLSNEPGYYLEGSHGIRIENLVFVQNLGKYPDTGKAMLGFETVSLAPIERSLIVSELLSVAEKEWLNSYHSHVFEMLSPYLHESEKAWLFDKTLAL